MGVEASIISRLAVTMLLVSGLAVPAFGQEATDSRGPRPKLSMTIEAPQNNQPQPSQTPEPGQTKPPAEPSGQEGLVSPPAGQQQPDANARPLSIDDAVQLALENNLNLKVVRLDPMLADLDIADARSSWTPSFTSDWAYQDSQRPSEGFLDGTGELSTTQSLSADFGFEQLLPWGSQYTLGFTNGRSETNSIFPGFNPETTTNFEFNFVQPLLQGFRIDGARQSFIVSRMNREISDLRLRNDVVLMTRDVRNAYWDFVNARGSLDVARQTLEVSEQQLRDNQKRVEVGTMAPIDVIEAEAEVAQNQSLVIDGERQVQEAEDQLRSLLFDPSSPDYWTTNFEPTDQPTVRLEPVDVEAATKNALAARTDLREARSQLEINDVNIRYAKDTTLPELSLNVGYRTAGLGGTQLIREEGPGGVPGDVVNETTRSYSDVLGDVFGLDFPTWSVGINFRYPLGRSNQDVSLARSRLQQRQAQLQIRDLERNIRQEIRTLARQVNTNTRLVESTRVARELAERNLEAAQKRFAVGLINQFEVIQRQRDLSGARFDELDAMIRYAKSVVDFEAAQETGAGIVTGTGVSTPGGGVGVGGTGVVGTGVGGNGAGGGEAGAPQGGAPN